jgi:putative chitinase
MILTVELIKAIDRHCQTKDIEKLLPFLNHALPRYEINTPLRIAMFLGQALTETMHFFYLKEMASGKAYEGRLDLGNDVVGEGVKFKGRGIFQTTGDANYKEVAKELGIDCVNNPELLEQPKWAVESACLYWKKRKLNAIADTGDIVKMSKRVNGGLKGIEERILLTTNAKRVLGVNDKLVC